MIFITMHKLNNYLIYLAFNCIDILYNNISWYIPNGYIAKLKYTILRIYYII